MMDVWIAERMVHPAIRNKPQARTLPTRWGHHTIPTL